MTDLERLTAFGYAVVAGPVYWTVTGYGNVWTVAPGDSESISQLVELAKIARRVTFAAAAEQAIAELEGYDTDWDTMTTAQKTAAMRVCIRQVGRIARLVVGQLGPT